MIVAVFLTVCALLGCAGAPPENDVSQTVVSEPVFKAAAIEIVKASASDPFFLLDTYTPTKKPVVRDGAPLTFVRKDTAQGDIVTLLTVETDNEKETSFAYVSDFNRLFDTSTETIPFSVEVFTVAKNGDTLSKSIDLGPHRVCSSFSQLPFDESRAFPFGLSVTFPDTEGKRNIWILFPGQDAGPEGPPQHSVFSFYEQANVKSFIHDIDDNGIFDLLLFEDIYEDSFGYETYITWHRWDGKNFNKYRSTNIIRKLRAFFESSRQTLLSRSWRRFFTYALLPEDAAALQEGSSAEAFRRIFRVQEDSGVEEAALYEMLFPREISQAGISDVVFPNVVENPFPLKAGGLESFRFTIRVTANEENYFFSARLEMNKNPFSGRMFHFLIDK
jgi:hypothetical protein